MSKVVKSGTGWRVVWEGKMCTPLFNSKGAAQAYFDMLGRGRRKPEYRTPLSHYGLIDN